MDPDIDSGSGGLVLTVAGLSKVFAHGRDEVAAFQGIDLDADEGAFVCLLGPSGCGKSTLLKIIAGFTRPTTGEVQFYGRSVDGPSIERVVVFQDAGAALFPWLTAEENVAYGLRYRFPDLERKQRRGTVERELSRVGLWPSRRQYPWQLSGGMLQRLQLARALAIEPRLLLMDEPFGALDAQTRVRLGQELRTIWSETRKSVLFVTHDIEEAVALGTKVVLFTAGPGATIRTEVSTAHLSFEDRGSQEFSRLCKEFHDELEQGAL